MQWLQLIYSTFLSVLLVFSSTGIRISQHWCGDRLVNATIWGDAKPCNHFSSTCEKKCEFHQKLAAAAKKCCSEKAITIEGGDDDFQVGDMIAMTNAWLTHFQPNALDVSQTSFIQRTERFHNHSPPLTGTELRVLIQSFLI